MNKLIIMRGIPASGKTTTATKMAKSTPHVVMLNRDIMRETMLNRWSKTGEKVVKAAQRVAAGSALKTMQNVVVIIDDTNIYAKQVDEWRALAARHGAEFQEIMHLCDPEEAIERDSKRDKPVGSNVIMRMHKELTKQNDLKNRKEREMRNLDFSPEFDAQLRTAIIVDVDGTLAKMRNRGPYEQELAGSDRLNFPIWRVVELLAKQTQAKIFFVSAREDTYCTVTANWLLSNIDIATSDYKDSELLMRPAGDNREDSVIKREIYDQNIKGKYNVLAVFDDRNRVVDMWRDDLHLPTFQVDNGDF